MFPTAEMLGIDLVLPDFSYLRERPTTSRRSSSPTATRTTSARCPTSCARSACPPAIYGGAADRRHGPLEARGAQAPRRAAARPRRRERVAAGPFGIEMVHMSHSIPDACAVASPRRLGTILLTGDYKFDQTPVDGGPADFVAARGARPRGLLCLCGDSTNADRPGVATSESSVGPALLETFCRCEGRIIVTCFASNVHRVQQVVDAAVPSGARSPWSGARCARTSTSPPTSGSRRRPRGC